MAMKDISDRQVCEMVRDYDPNHEHIIPVPIYIRLAKLTGQCEKVARLCVERAIDRGYLDCGTSANYPWLTDKGKELLSVPPPLDQMGLSKIPI